MGRFKNALAQARDAFNKWRRENAVDGTRLPVDGDPRMQERNAALYLEMAEDHGVTIEEDDDGPVAYGPLWRMRGFDDDIRALIAEGRYYTTQQVSFEGLGTPGAALDKETINVLLRSPDVALSWVSATDVQLSGMYCNVMGMLSTVSMVNNPPLGVSNEEA